MHYSCQVPHFNFSKSRRLALLPTFLVLKELKAWKKGNPYQRDWLLFLETLALQGQLKNNSAVFREINRVREDLRETQNAEGDPFSTVTFSEEVKLRRRQLYQRFSAPFTLEARFPFTVSGKKPSSPKGSLCGYGFPLNYGGHC